MPTCAELVGAQTARERLRRVPARVPALYIHGGHPEHDAGQVPSHRGSLARLAQTGYRTVSVLTAKNVTTAVLMCTG
jgi:hypothetical protein